MRSPITAWLGAALATLVLVELGAWLLVGLGALQTLPPTYGRLGYWRGDHPEFGVWHAPGGRYQHRTDCFETEYTANSVGARDRERTVRSERPRVVVLGDSFLEGWGLPESERMSNLLETHTGIEHLNFAMTHFGPYQSYLVYRSLAQRFDHEAVLIGVLPQNDFRDIDFQRAIRTDATKYRYRPYLVGDPPDLRHLDHREARLRRWLRQWSWAGSALVTVAGRLDEADEREPDTPERPHSGFYDFEQRPLRLLDAILARLVATAAGKRVVVVLIPGQPDFLRRLRDGPDPLSTQLRAAGKAAGYELVNLLPLMSAGGADWTRYFFDCDFHWNALGNAAAARALRKALGADFYGFASR